MFMFETCQKFTMKNKESFLSVVMATLLITWNMLNIRQAISTSDSGQAKVPGKDYMKVKPA